MLKEKKKLSSKETRRKALVIIQREMMNRKWAWYRAMNIRQAQVDKMLWLIMWNKSCIRRHLVSTYYVLGTQLVSRERYRRK